MKIGGTSYILFLAAATPLLRAAPIMCTAMPIPNICGYQHHGMLTRQQR